MKLIIVLILSCTVLAEAPDVQLYGDKPAPPDSKEKGTIVTMISTYQKIKETIKWMNRCYSAYKGVIYTYKEIETYLNNFDDYFANVYNTFQSSVDTLNQGDLLAALFGLEDVFKQIDTYFVTDVRYLNYLVNKDLTGGIPDAPWTTGNGQEDALKVMQTIYDNTAQSRGIVFGQSSNRRAMFEYQLFTTSELMRQIGATNENMQAVRDDITNFKELNGNIQSMGEALALQKMLATSLYEMDLQEYQLAINDLEANKQKLISLNRAIYEEVHNRAASVLAFENIGVLGTKIDPEQIDNSNPLAFLKRDTH
jgi:hypothetical protein